MLPDWTELERKYHSLEVQKSPFVSCHSRWLSCPCRSHRVKGEVVFPRAKNLSHITDSVVEQVKWVKNGKLRRKSFNIFLLSENGQNNSVLLRYFLQCTRKNKILFGKGVTSWFQEIASVFRPKILINLVRYLTTTYFRDIH